MPEEVQLVPYEPTWPSLFHAEATRLRGLLPGAVIEHVGSTSVPGLRAKPFIDILAGIEDECSLASVVSTLKPSAYSYVPEAEAVVPERRFFRRLDESPGYHLHVVARSAPLWVNLPLFRDTLRSSPSIAKEYLQLKLQLAKSYASDVDAYTTAKGPFVDSILKAHGVPNR